MWDDEPKKLAIPPLVELHQEEEDANIANGGDSGFFASIFLTRSNGTLQRIYPIPTEINEYPPFLNCETIYMEETSPMLDIQFFPTTIPGNEELKIICCSIINASNQLFLYGLLRKSPLCVNIQSVFWYK